VLELWYIPTSVLKHASFTYFSILGCHTLCGNAVSYMATNNGILVYEGPCNNISSGRYVWPHHEAIAN